MDKLKFGVLLCALAGLVGCFLPIAPQTPSLWSLHRIDLLQTLSMIATYAVALAVAIAAVIRPPFLRIHAITCIAAFAAALWRLRQDVAPFLAHGGIGAKLMVIGPMVGLVVAVAAIALPQKSRS